MHGLLTAVASLVEQRLQGMQPSVAAASSLQSTGSIVAVHKPGCSMTRGIVLEQGSNLCLLHWEAGSLPLSHR